MFDLFIKVYFIDRKLIATSECHFDDNLNFMQNCSGQAKKNRLYFCHITVYKATTLPLKAMRSSSFKTCFQQLKRTVKAVLSDHFSIPRSI